MNLEKLIYITRTVLGSILASFSFLSLAPNVVFGFSGILLSLLIIPKTSNVITNKVGLLKRKPSKYIAVSILMLIFLLSPRKHETQVFVNITEGKDDPQKVMEFQKDLIDLVNHYKEAQIRSVVITQIKFGGADLEKAKEYTRETSEIWQRVYDTAQKFQKYQTYSTNQRWAWINNFSHLLLTRTARATDDNKELNLALEITDLPKEFSSSNESREVQLDNGEKNLIQTKWDMVEIRRATLPDKSLIRAVSEEFGTTAKKSKELIDQYHGDMAKVWKDEESYNKSKENLFRGLKTASSVGLTVGGGVVFMGEIAAVSATPSLVAGAKLATETVVLAFAKTDAILEILETGVIIATGDEKNAASITTTREGISPIRNIVSITDLIKNPTLADGGNIDTISNLAGPVLETLENLGNKTLNTFVFEEGPNKYKVKITNGFAKMSPDGIADGYFSKDFEYDLTGWKREFYQNQENERTTADNQKNTRNGYRGDAACWRGSEMDNDLYQRILKYQDRHNKAKEECERDLGVKVSDLSHPRWLEVMQCACDKDPEAAVARTYCCSGATIEEIRNGIINDLRRTQENIK